MRLEITFYAVMLFSETSIMVRGSDMKYSADHTGSTARHPRTPWQPRTQRQFCAKAEHDQASRARFTKSEDPNIVFELESMEMMRAL